jgi:hypothetical protein
MANSVKTLMVVLGLKNQEYLKNMAESKKELRAMKQEVKATQKSLQEVSKGMAVFGAAVLAAAGLSAKAAIDIEATRGAFEHLAESNGQAADEILKALQKSSMGTVAAKDLMLSANRAMTLGVAKNTKDFAALMEIARDRARTMGLSTTQAFNDIVTGIGRGSPLILDNLGLVVNLTEANEKYAQEIGKSTSELTEAEKQQALLNEVIRQGEKSLDKNSLSALNATESLQALKASLVDVAGVLGSALLPSIQSVTSIITKVVKGVQDWAERNPELSKTLTMITTALGGVSVAIAGLIWVLPKLRAAWLAFSTVFVASPIGLVLTALGALTAAIIYCWQNWDKVSKLMGDTWDYLKIEFAEFFKAVNPFAPAIQRWADELIASSKASLVARDAQSRLNKALKDTGTSTAATTPYIDAMTGSMEEQANAAKVLCDQINAVIRAQAEMTGVARTATGKVITGAGGGAVSIYDQNAIYNMLRSGAGSAGIHAKYDKYHGSTAVDDVINAIREGQWGGAKGVAAPGLAMGGSLLSSGMAWVGERGPELLELPRGAKVTPLDKSPLDFGQLKSAITEAVYSGLANSNISVMLDGKDITDRVSINLGLRTLSRQQLGGS